MRNAIPMSSIWLAKNTSSKNKSYKPTTEKELPCACTRTLTEFSSWWKILIWISEKWLHFPEFTKFSKRNNLRKSQISRYFLSEITVPFRIPFSVEWFAFRKFTINNFRISGNHAQKIPYHLSSLVDWKTPRVVGRRWSGWRARLERWVVRLKASERLGSAIVFPFCGVGRWGNTWVGQGFICKSERTSRFVKGG